METRVGSEVTGRMGWDGVGMEWDGMGDGGWEMKDLM